MGSTTSAPQCWCKDVGAGCPLEPVHEDVLVQSVKVPSRLSHGESYAPSGGGAAADIAEPHGCRDATQVADSGANSVESTEAPLGSSNSLHEASPRRSGPTSDAEENSVSLRVTGTEPSEADQQLDPLDLEDLGSIPEDHRVACAKLAATLGPDGVAEARASLVPGETLFSCFLRFLKPNNFDAAAAARHLQADLEWRKTARPSDLADMSPEDVAGCEARFLDEYLPTWHQGFDRSGRPLIFACYGKFRFKPMMAQTSVEKLLQLYVHQAERSARLCGEQSKKLGKNIYNMVIVVDADGWDANNVRTSASYAWAKGMANIDQEHYPERLGRMYVINAPKVVMYFWKVVQLFLRDEMKTRVEILSTRDQWFPRLCEFADIEQLPPEYGGRGPHRGHG